MKVVSGWVNTARHVPSPNFNARPIAGDISLLVIHNISLPPDRFGRSWIEDLFLNRLNHAAHPYFETLRGLEVSAHFLLRRDGRLLQFVSLNERAWHAGQSQFEGRTNCNDFSIGIELEGSDTRPFTRRQYHQLVTLTLLLQQAFPQLTTERIVGHSDIAPGRKTDPGPCFDWVGYRAAVRRTSSAVRWNRRRKKIGLPRSGLLRSGRRRQGVPHR